MPLPCPSPVVPPAAGQVILQQDHVLHSVVFISRGFVDVSVYGQLLETLGPDDHMAELALLPVPATLGEEVRADCMGCVGRMGCVGCRDFMAGMGCFVVSSKQHAISPPVAACHFPLQLHLLSHLPPQHTYPYISSSAMPPCSWALCCETSCLRATAGAPPSPPPRSTTVSSTCCQLRTSGACCWTTQKWQRSCGSGQNSECEAPGACNTWLVGCWPERQ